MRFSTSPERIEYNSPLSVYWKCRVGHEWRGHVAARTLFGLECPICNAEMATLPIGTTYGCLTIIGDLVFMKKKLRQIKLLNSRKREKIFCREKETLIQMWIRLIFMIIGLEILKQESTINVDANVD